MRKRTPPQRYTSDLDPNGNIFNWPVLAFRRTHRHEDSDVLDGAMFRPFGLQDYGYPNDKEVVASWATWALTTWGSFSVDPLEGIGILATSMILQENNTFVKFFITNNMGTGASWVYNVQAGYCWYHYFIKQNYNQGLLLGSYAALIGDVGSVASDTIYGENMVNHESHAKGAALGVAVALLLDRVRGKNKKFSKKGAVIPLAAILIMTLRYYNLTVDG
jgi:hypothetical protein